jgi:phage tail sheath protein FI
VPSYLAPGVYVEEVSYTAPTIEGVGTTTTAFAGPTLTGPIGGIPYGGLPASGSAVAGSPSGGIPQLLTSFGDFQNIYGGYGNLSLSTAGSPKNINYMAMAVQAFFANGGSELYVSRVYANKPGGSPNTIDPGIATSGASGADKVVVAGRFPGAFLNGKTVTAVLTATRVSNFNNLANLPPGTLLGEPGATPTFYSNGAGGTFMSNANTPVALTSGNFPSKLFMLTMQVTAPGATGQQMVFNGLGFDSNHPSYIGNVLGVSPPRPVDALQNQIYFEFGSSLNTPFALFGALFPNWVDPSTQPVAWQASHVYTSGEIILDSNGNLEAVTTAGTSGATQPTWNTTSGETTADGGATWTNHGLWHPVASFALGVGTGTAVGSDGAEPMAVDYASALQYLKALEDIAIVATPGSSIYSDAADIMIGSLIPHVEAQRAYRVAILEAGPNLLDSDYESVRAQIDSSYTALYVPWVSTPNPLAVAGNSAPSQIFVPPSGFVAGIYARSDTEHSVAKAPANEVVLGAVDLERHINFAEQSLLNPLGINCIRFFPDRGFRVWGARTASSDSELKYVNVRRYLIYLEHSIDNGTQWAVFENNGPALWARVKDSVDSFLNNEFAEGNLLGTSPSDAYFVRCDRTTMTQNDLDNGRLICLVGVALLKPAEFVIFRIGQKTANASS